MFPTERTRTGASIPTADPAPARLGVALLHPTYWPEVRRGAERLVHDLAMGLRGAGQRPVLITSHRGRSSSRVEDGVPVVRNRRLPEGFARPFGYPEHFGHLPLARSSLRRGDFSIAHAFYPADALAATAWARRDGRASVFTVTGIPQRDVILGRLWRRRAWRRATESSDAVIVLSQAARDSLRWLGVEPTVIAPGVDLAAFRRNVERAPRPTVFCPAAIEDVRKRVPLVVDAVEHLRRRMPDLELVLGRPRAGPVDAQLDRPWISLVDIDGQDDLTRAYSRAWVTVLASHAEAFGLVLLESLACGTPVVGRAEGGVPEIVSDAVGALFEGDDPGRLADSIEVGLSLAGNPGGEAACRSRAEAFSLERCVAAHLALYRSLSRVRADDLSGNRE